MKRNVLTVDELAVYLDMSKSAIYKLSSQGLIKGISPFGKRIYFKVSDINDLLEGRVTPVPTKK